MSRKTPFAALVATVFSLGACHRAPDPDYLRDYARAHDLIDTYRGKGDVLEQANSILDGLLKREPDFPHAHVEMARLLMTRGHMVGDRFTPGTLENSERELRTAISLDQTFCDGHIVLGHVLYRMHRYPDALQALDRADALACENPWRLMNRLEVDMQLQRLDEASDTLAKLKAVAATSPGDLHSTIENRVLGAQMWIAFSKGNQAEMLEQIRAQLKLTSEGDAWGMGNAASSFVLAGAFDEAIMAAREALHRMQYGAAERTLGVALFGASLWRDSHPPPAQQSTSADEWAEAESLVDFNDASKDLWGSLANRDVAFRALLQSKIADYRSDNKARETGLGK